MTKENIVDITVYEKRIRPVTHMMSDELKEAIQCLIQRLREANPLQPSPNRYAAEINKKAR